MPKSVLDASRAIALCQQLTSLNMLSDLDVYCAWSVQYVPSALNISPNFRAANIRAVPWRTPELRRRPHFLTSQESS